MPGGDRTGPQGQGAMTGRGAGLCAGFATAGYMNPGRGGFRHGDRFGRGGGRGHRFRYYATGMPGWARGQWDVSSMVPLPFADSGHTRGNELAALNRQAEYFENALQNIKRRIARLESSTPEEKK